MKLRAKLSAMTLLPVFIFGIIILLITLSKVSEAMEEQIQLTLHSTAIGALQAYQFGFNAEYHKEDNGEVWIGDEVKISENSTVVDNILNETGMVSTFFYDDVRIMTSIKNENGERAVGTTASSEVKQTVINEGKPYFSNNLEILGELYFAYYYPIYQIGSSNEIIGMFFVGSPQTTVNQTINSLLTTFIIITAIIISICVLFAIITTNTLVRSLKAEISIIEHIANGNLRPAPVRKTLKRRDEVGDMSRASQTLLLELRNIIGTVLEQSNFLSASSLKLKTTTNQTSETMDQVDTAVSEMSSGAMSQAEETQNASVQIISMGNLIEETVLEVDRLSTYAERMRSSSEESSIVLDNLKEINDRSKKAIDIIHVQTNTTNTSALKIQEATRLITAIAKETNLLSLNASIEAARAGEHGRGFSVVAAQIQKLATESNASAKQIEQIILSLIQDSSKAVEIMDEVKDIVDHQILNVDTTRTNFKNVQEDINSSLTCVTKIASFSDGLNLSRTSIVDSIQNLSAIAEENAASCEETSAAANEVTSTITDISNSATNLQDAAAKLESSIKIFQL